MNRKEVVSLSSEIEQALKPGRFVRYDAMFGFVQQLDRVREKIASLAARQDPRQVVDLYEIFLSGCYEKIEECDDSGGSLGMFFQDLFCGWVQARQAAGCPAKETVEQILRWMERDDYGFCYHIEKDLAKALDADGLRLLVAHFQGAIESGLNSLTDKSPRPIFEFDNKVRLPALSLKEIFLSRNAVQPYAQLCERLGLSPRDCQHLAEMSMGGKRWSEALAWVDKGLMLAPVRNWHNEDCYSLAQLRAKILARLGRREDALAQAWKDFESDPCEMAYREFMGHVPKADRSEWHERAMTAAEKRDLGSFITLCVETKEWARLATRIHTATDTELEALSHYCTEPAAKGLAKRDALAAAKLRRALGLRILNSGKSKYYDAALDHLDKARKLYLQAGREKDWQAVVITVRTRHSRKTGFLQAFLLLGTKTGRPAGSSFVQRARARWRRHTS